MATVIKSNSLREPPAGTALRTVAFRFDDIADGANEYLDNVRKEAAQIIQKAHQEAERIRQEATASGRQAAMDAAHRVLDEKVARQMETLLPALEKAICGIEDARHEWLTHWERLVVSLAAAIASRVIRRELTAQPEIPIELIREALSLAAGADKLTLHLNPADRANLGPQVERLAAVMAQLAPSEIVADDSVDPGGCRVVTKFGEVDQCIKTQLERIVEELTE